MKKIIYLINIILWGVLFQGCVDNPIPTRSVITYDNQQPPVILNLTEIKQPIIVYIGKTFNWDVNIKAFNGIDSIFLNGNLYQAFGNGQLTFKTKIPIQMPDQDSLRIELSVKDEIGLKSIYSFYIYGTRNLSPIYVSTTGNDGNNGETPATAFATVKYAVSQASDGQSIVLAAGTYTEQNISINKEVTISGANAGTTIIQAQSTAPDGTAPVANNTIIVLAGTANVTLNNLTLRYGNSTSAGGAIAVYAGQTLTVENCNILNCYTLWGGGGISSAGNLTINNSAIANNTANANGGGINAVGGSVSIANSVIYNNTSKSPLGGGGNGGGGAIFLKDATLSLKNNTIAYNKCTVSGQLNLGVRMEGAGTSAITKNTLNTNNLFFNSINSNYASGVDIAAAYNTFFADAANNTNNIFSFAYLPALSSTTIPSTNSNYPTGTQVALGTFAMGSNGVYSLPILSGSIAIGAANPATATATDIHGTTRTTPDIGAYEYVGN